MSRSLEPLRGVTPISVVVFGRSYFLARARTCLMAATT